jgi:hypothetical protein
LADFLSIFQTKQNFFKLCLQFPASLFLLLLLLLNRLPPDITGGQGLKNIFQFFLQEKTILHLHNTRLKMNGRLIVSYGRRFPGRIRSLSGWPGWRRLSGRRGSRPA